MISCTKCNFQIEDGLNFCPGCGAEVTGKQPQAPMPVINPEITAPCKQCGYEVDDGLKFCPGCGTSVVQSKPAPPPMPPPKVSAAAPPPTPLKKEESNTIFCSNCDNQVTSQMSFCFDCGTKVGVTSSVAPMPLSTPPTQSSRLASLVQSTGDNLLDKGKLLISGNGKYNFRSLLYWAFMIICNIGFFVISLDLRDTVSTAPRNATSVTMPFFGTMSLSEASSLTTGMIVIAVLLIIFGIVMAIFVLRRYASEIHVYENVITGKNVQGFSPTLQEFSIPISDVINVDVLKQTGVVIRTQYGTYTSYTKKADEIRDAILSNINEQ